MLRPVERSMTVSAPQRVAQVIFSTSSSMEEVTAELPILALTFTRNRLPMIIGSISGWLTLAGGAAGAPRRALLPAHLWGDVLADRHVLHLRRDLAPPRIGELGHGAARSAA